MPGGMFIRLNRKGLPEPNGMKAKLSLPRGQRWGACPHTAQKLSHEPAKQPVQSTDTDR